MDNMIDRKSKSPVLGTIALIMAVCSCGGVNFTPDVSLLPEFHKTYFYAENQALSDTVDLFIDYSTCVAEAKNSSYYKATHPSIVDCSPVFWSIKGNSITKETDDRQKVYQLLSSIAEVNHADIKQAVRQIVSGNHQAVLITDGEYFQQGAVKDNLNNPYIAEEIRVWLNKGRDIYIYSEPYVEKGNFPKYRYYMFFTDALKDNNINDRFSRSAPKETNVKMLHLSNGVPKICFSKSYPEINPSLSAVPDNCTAISGVEVQEYGIGWKDIKNFLDGDDIDIRYVFRGLFLDRKDSDCFRIKEVKPVVYSVYEQYQNFCDSSYTGGCVPPLKKLTQVKGVFEIDEDIFEETGEIVLCIDDDFDGVGNALSADMPNLLKVDFVVDEVENNFSGNEELCNSFKWNSISSAQNYAQNTSVYESINQVIQDPLMNPAGKVIYSLYISTSKL